jgi:hypothetical protein
MWLLVRDQLIYSRINAACKQPVAEVRQAECLPHLKE